MKRDIAWIEIYILPRKQAHPLKTQTAKKLTKITLQK